MTTITELSNELEIMEKRLEVFKKLKVNHKIMEDTHNHALYSIAPGYFQSWARWWQGEKQKKTYEHLDRTKIWNKSAIQDHPKGLQNWMMNTDHWIW